jgi:sugar phosphate isomerase/epimerase
MFKPEHLKRTLSRRSFIATTAGTAACVVAAGLLADEPKAQTGSKRFPFYAMDTGLVGPDVPTLKDKVRLLKKLGFWGIDYTFNHEKLPELLELLDEEGLHLSCVYLSPALEDKPDERLAESIKRMKGRPTRVELAIRSSTFRPSDPAGDQKGLGLIKRVSDLCADTGPVVSIYPHRGIWTERTEDGVRLAKLSGRKTVGTNFNLVHWKWLEPNEPPAKVLKDALPHLFSVSINGLAGDKIVPLDEGDFDLLGFMQTVKQVGYRGQVGLQGYGVPGRSADHLKHSMDKWRGIRDRLSV